MKFIYYTNNIVYGTTILLYMTIIFGMYMQVLLGIVQVLLFLVLLFNYNKFTNIIQRHLQIYGIGVVIYFTIFFICIQLNVNSLWFLFVTPMLIATYFTYIVHELKQQVL